MVNYLQFDYIKLISRAHIVSLLKCKITATLNTKYLTHLNSHRNFFYILILAGLFAKTIGKTILYLTDNH
jgi:hypothetical protein